MPQTWTPSLALPCALTSAGLESGARDGPDRSPEQAEVPERKDGEGRISPGDLGPRAIRGLTQNHSGDLEETWREVCLGGKAVGTGAMWEGFLEEEWARDIGIVARGSGE